jgi:hypothetical protein
MILSRDIRQKQHLQKGTIQSEPIISIHQNHAKSSSANGSKLGTPIFNTSIPSDYYPRSFKD